MHAETMVIDFDFDYANQLKGFENRRFNNNIKIAPKGFIGTGILSAPFLFLGNLLDNIFTFFEFEQNIIMNTKILFYSLSSPFFLFLSILLLQKFLDDLDNKLNISYVALLIFGSGLPYFAFERYSMTHVFEAFTISAVLYCSNKYYLGNTNNKIYAFLIPFLSTISLLVKWTNYYVLLIPLFVKLLFKESYLNDKKLINNYYFYAGFTLGVSLFTYLSYSLYGVITFNPQYVYGTSGMLTNYVVNDQSVVEFITINFKNLLNIFFTKEFGIFWFSPLIFAGLLTNLYLFIVEKNKMPFLISLLMFGQTFAIVLIWRSTASSYGFRYLFNLVPVSLIIVAYFLKKYEYKIVKSYLYYFSIIGIISLFFFETTELTQLSTVDEMNSFGRVLRFTEPNYLEGFFKSLLDLNSYLKIFTTSFIGLISFKFILSFLTPDTLINILSSLGLPVDNQDFIEFIIKAEDIEYFKLILISLFFLYFAKLFVKYQKL
tara:strand:- start:11947 stop:13410 length:1464 start_codon:yes stop_codon:yes gene_type:complete